MHLETGLHLHRICRISPTPNLPVKRHLMEFGWKPVEVVQESEIGHRKGYQA